MCAEDIRVCPTCIQTAVLPVGQLRREQRLRRGSSRTAWKRTFGRRCSSTAVAAGGLDQSAPNFSPRRPPRHYRVTVRSASGRRKESPICLDVQNKCST